MLALQLQALPANVEALRKEIDAASDRTTRQLADLTRSLDAEHTARTTQASAVTQKLEQLGAGLHLEAVGVAWLALGIMLATIPAEAASVF